MILPWQIQSSQTVADCRIFRVRKDLAVNPRTGVAHEIFVCEHPAWVNVIPLTPDDEIILIEQWRHGTRSVQLETPGGLVEAGESPLECGRRELLEETGYQANRSTLLGSIHPNPAIQDNLQHYVLATGCRPVADPQLDHAEDIVVRCEPLQRVPSLIRSGQITHAIVIAGLYLLDLHRRHA